MRRPTFSGHSSLGGGLPAGSLHENKVGNAFDTLEDIVYAELPNGRRLIVAALSNGYAEGEAEPWDIARLNGFTGLLIARLGIADGLPAPGYPDLQRSTDDGHHAWRIDAPCGMASTKSRSGTNRDPTAAESAEYVDRVRRTAQPDNAGSTSAHGGRGGSSLATSVSHGAQGP